MSKEKIARELVNVAKDLISADVAEVLDELNYFQINMAEGSRKNGLPTLEGKKFKNVRDLEKAVERFGYPDGGYDKVFIDLKMKEGPDLHFKYYHSKKGPSLSRQFDNYVKKNLKKASMRTAKGFVPATADLDELWKIGQTRLDRRPITSSRTADDLDLFEPEAEDPNFIAKVRSLRTRLSQLTKLKNKKLSSFGIGVIRGRNTVEELVDVLNGIVGGSVTSSNNRIAAKFKLGKVVMTSGVSDKMKEDPSFKRFVDKSFREYSRGDWGDTSREDAEMNDEAVESGDRIMGVYKSGSDKIWIITEWNRSATTILFPSEY